LVETLGNGLEASVIAGDGDEVKGDENGTRVMDL